MLNGALHGEHEFIEIHRLGDVIEGSLFHGLDRRVDGAEGGQEHNGDLRHGFAERIQQVQPGQRCHADIAQDGVIRRLIGLAEGVHAVTGRLHRKAGLAQGFGQHVSIPLVVIHNEN